jgi:outer membrane protein
MKTPQKILALAALMVFSPWAQANELLETYRQAVAFDATLINAEFQRDAALEAKPQADGAILPNVTAGASVARVRQKQVTAFNGTNRSVSGISGVQVQATQPLYNAPAFSRQKEANVQVDLAELQLLAQQQGLILRVAAAYFEVLAAQDLVRTAETENQAVAKQLDQAKKRFEVGLAAVTDKQEAQARYDITVAQKIAADQQLSNARRVLAEIANQGEIRGTSLDTNMPLGSPDPTNIETWVQAAREANFEARIAQQQSLLAQQQIETAKGNHLPVVNATGEFTQGTRAGVFGGQNRELTAGLQVSMPLYNGGRLSSGVRAAQASSLAARANYEGTLRRIERQTRDAYTAVLTGIAQVKALQQAVVSSKTALDASQVGLQVGARTSVDVLAAQRDLFNAQRQYDRARYDYVLSVLRLKQAAGRLNENDLAEVDALVR